MPETAWARAANTYLCGNGIPARGGPHLGARSSCTERSRTGVPDGSRPEDGSARMASCLGGLG
ncbi:hypothetical protein V7968_35415 [Nocardia vulneris]|uniref:hypothetical protein n=1 Tax=Nocardia vulneris TaxID=1141657 RepID=UPI0030CEBA62